MFLPDYDIGMAQIALPGLRRLAQQPAAAAGGVRHLRDEGRAQRGAEPVDPRRLVGRVVRRRERLGDPDRRRRRRPGPPRRPGGGRAVRPDRDQRRAALLRARRRRAPGPLDRPAPAHPRRRWDRRSSASRMVRDYVTTLYLPATHSSREVLADGAAAGRDLAVVRRTGARRPGPTVAVEHVEARPASGTRPSGVITSRSGPTSRSVTLAPADVLVQLRRRPGRPQRPAGRPQGGAAPGRRRGSGTRDRWSPTQSEGMGSSRRSRSPSWRPTQSRRPSSRHPAHRWQSAWAHRPSSSRRRDARRHRSVSSCDGRR